MLDSETPSFASSNYGASNTIYSVGSITAAGESWNNSPHLNDALTLFDKYYAKPLVSGGSQKYEEKMPMAIAPQYSRRYVQIFIVDPDKRVPLDQCTLYKSEQFLTDATDQELFYEVPIRDRLDLHNKSREKIRDDEASNKSGRDIFLRPIKIRDLTMHVVTVAGF